MRVMALTVLLTGCALNPVAQYRQDKNKAYFERLNCRVEMGQIVDHKKLSLNEIIKICALMYPAPNVPDICEGLE